MSYDKRMLHKRESSSKIFPSPGSEENVAQASTADIGTTGLKIDTTDNVDDEERDICSPLPIQSQTLSIPLSPNSDQPTSTTSDGITRQNSVPSIPLRMIDVSGSTLAKSLSSRSLSKVSHRSRSSFNLAERLSFSFMNDIITDGKKRDLLVSEYPPVESMDDCGHLGRLFLNLWDREQKIRKDFAKVSRVMVNAPDLGNHVRFQLYNSRFSLLIGKLV